MVGIRTANYETEFANALNDATRIDIAVAFASSQGLDFKNCQSRLSALLENGGQVRILVDLRLAFTNPAFLEDILQWKRRCLNVDIRHYDAKSSGIFHPKVYLFHYESGNSTVIVGSANWSREGFLNNIEYGLVLEGEKSSCEVAAVVDFFESNWNSDGSKIIDEAVLEVYRPYWRRRQGFERKARRRSENMWYRVRDATPKTKTDPTLAWPNGDSAFLLGVITARGTINWDEGVISIEHRTGGPAYSHNGQAGYIGKGDVSFAASSVVPIIPEYVAQRLAKSVPSSGISVEIKSIHITSIGIRIDPSSAFMSNLQTFLGNRTSYKEFRIPSDIIAADRELQEEFLRGFGTISGLVSSGTYSPTGTHQIWLRPATENVRQFDQLVSLLENKIGYVTYKNRRQSRDVAVKVRCEDWMDIGFGIDWMDAIVEEGARLNGALDTAEAL